MIFDGNEVLPWETRTAYDELMTSVMTGCPGRRFLACAAGLKSQESQLFFCAAGNSDGTSCRAKRHIFSGKYFLINKIGSNRFVWNRNFKNGILSNSFPNKSRIVEGTFLQKKGEKLC